MCWKGWHWPEHGLSIVSRLQYHAVPEFPCAQPHQGESVPFRAPSRKHRLSAPCDSEYLPTFSPNTTLGEFAHLPFLKTSLANLKSSPPTQPSPGCCLVPRLQHIFGAADLDACVDKWQGTLACSGDNFALSSLSSLHSLLYLSPCGILGAVSGCLAPPAVEGEYCPWDRELLQGQWLQHLSKEEEMGTCEGTRFASCPSPPRIPSSHLKYASKSRPHMEGLFCKAILKGSGHTWAHVPDPASLDKAQTSI